MEKLEALKSYLIAKSNLSAGAISAQVQSMVLKPKGVDEGNQVLLHNLSYRAVINLIGFPYQVQEIASFNAHLMTWLADNDDREELEDAYPSISVDLQDAQTANLEVSLGFEEPVYISSSLGGEIEFADQTWVLGSAEIDWALSAEVTGNLVNLAN
ncbi:hypothetical protein OA92_15280 [Marinomonas sp. SBI22]|uniref:phage tail protein n=1 Tax=unclassified Marinomonas TaxID=196814 RepID=UPI0007AF4D9F|nr:MULTISPECIES: phage tail protein [unclassified Marinomonas]KZM40940.1 hypothetical protein OA92_15280 [Marinomonas sp. SBI22]KZM42780.1 hypothetical protein OA91_13485 [Marinomonas sp. SBI8L]